MVPLFLDGEVSFLPQNSFPCSFQPFGVCLVIGTGAPEWVGMRMLAKAGSKNCDDTGTVLPSQDGECLEAQRRLVALLMAFVCSLPRNVRWWGAGWRGTLPEHPPASVHTKLHGQMEGAAQPWAITRSVSFPGGNPSAGMAAPGAAGIELFLQLSLHGHHSCQVLCRAGEQTPSR